MGQECSSEGVCVDIKKGGNGGESGGISGGEGGSEGGSSGGSDGGSSSGDGDTVDDDQPVTGPCEPGKTQKCEYDGYAASEGVGPCKAAVRTCNDDRSWGKCEGEVLPVAENNEELCTNDIDDDCDGEVDNKEGSCKKFWHSGDTGDTDNNEPGNINVGFTGEYSDAYVVPSTEEICADSCIPIKAECADPMDSEKAEGLCNGLDDDCDGVVDEGCPCSPGQTQPCFAGPPNFRNVGKCTDGVQTCKVTLRGSSTGTWGECQHGISPQPDVCDNADNNCNGCVDDQICCAPPIDCAYDLTEGGTKPFKPFQEDKIIDGTKIYDASHKFNDADTATWEWSLTQGPCDIVLGKVNSYAKAAKTQAELAEKLAESDRKTVVSGVGLSQFKVKFRLSGNYTLHLKVTRENGEVYECEWVIRVVSEGLRIELCWDKTGSHSKPTSGRDLDLHMGKNEKTSTWESGACYYGSKTPSWGYGTTQNYDKEGNLKTMSNPRLDMDNIRTAGEPENINVDNPNNGDVFRVGVNYFSWGDYSPTSLETHPVINVYCGGTLKATYGVEPQVKNFTNSNNFWEVVEVTWKGDYSSDQCELNLKWNNGYVIRSSMPKYTDWENQ